MVDLINKNGQGRELTDKVPQFVGLTVLLVIAVLKQSDLPVLFLDTVQNHLLGVCYSHQAKEFM